MKRTADKYDSRKYRSLKRFQTLGSWKNYRYALFALALVAIWWITLIVLAQAVSKQTVHTSFTSVSSIKQDSPVQNTKVLTLYLESPSTVNGNIFPLPARNTLASNLEVLELPSIKECEFPGRVLPIDDFPKVDPYLPWIHDYFATSDASLVKIIAQNKRRCMTGYGQDSFMNHWEPQMSLFQPVSIKEERLPNGTTLYRLASPDDATIKETRIICRFHNDHVQEEITFSEFPFNYEYLWWRLFDKPMFKYAPESDIDRIPFSQLLFNCPVPDVFRASILEATGRVYLDLIPIRTPARRTEYLFTEQHVGPIYMTNISFFDADKNYGNQHYLPRFTDSGRWANLPICASARQPKRKLVGCTWTAARYHRRGDKAAIDDALPRLREWLAFHEMVGFDHMFIYDNSQLETEQEQSPIMEVAKLFPGFATYHRWPCSVCNNNRPMNKNPGERSSQYAAEASCRERYGSSSEWMSFFDIDEYLVPLEGSGIWTGILDNHQRQGHNVLKMRSSRGRPRVQLMEDLIDPKVCQSNQKYAVEACLVPRRNETFLRVYNCDSAISPKPEQFERAMKQIFRPDYVLSHFVHYVISNKDLSRYYEDFADKKAYVQDVDDDRDYHEAFLNEDKEAVMVHSKSILPTEAMTRNATCRPHSPKACELGYACSDSTEYNDVLMNRGLLRDDAGRFCNCWVNERVERYFVPKLISRLDSVPIFANFSAS